MHVDIALAKWLLKYLPVCAIRGGDGALDQGREPAGVDVKRIIPFGVGIRRGIYPHKSW